MCDWSKEAFNKNENIIETEELFKGETENRFGCSAAELIAKNVYKEIEGPKGFKKLVVPKTNARNTEDADERAGTKAQTRPLTDEEYNKANAEFGNWKNKITGLQLEDGNGDEDDEDDGDVPLGKKDPQQQGNQLQS